MFDRDIHIIIWCVLYRTNIYFNIIGTNSQSIQIYSTYSTDGCCITDIKRS